MGFALSFSFKSNSRFRRARGLVVARSRCGAAWVQLFADPTAAQTPTAPSTEAQTQDKLVIDADQLVYDKDKNTISAVGSVQLFYQGRVIQADRVTYDRATKRVYAEGHAKMTDEHGNIVYGSRFALSDDFRDGFIDSVQVLTDRQDALYLAAGGALEWRRYGAGEAARTPLASHARTIRNGRHSGR